MSAEYEGNSRGGAHPRDFATEPVYQSALALCGVVLDLELKFPDDEREALYAGMRTCAVETGAIIASAFGMAEDSARGDYWERARSRLMECRHYVLVAHSRYVLDNKDVAGFDQAYFELLAKLSMLVESALAAETVRAGDEE